MKPKTLVRHTICQRGKKPPQKKQQKLKAKK